MRSRCRFVALPALASVWLLATAAWAAAAPPPNDNYLASTVLANAATPDKVARHVHQSVDTTQATVQPDLLDPDKDGQPLGGGGPETTQCNGVSFGKTVWYDVHPEVSGAGEITANGYDTVIAVYRYDVNSAKITGLLACQNAGAGETLLIPTFQKGTAYTIQIGGVGDTGGQLDFNWEFFADRDGDGVLDRVPDRCPNIKGPDTESGCPPRLSPSVNLSFGNNPIRFSAATVGNLPQGTRVSVRCKRCGVSTHVTIPRANKRVTLRGLLGRTAPAGAVLDVIATHPKNQTKRFQYGAIGARLRYTVRGGKLVGPSRRCMLPGSTKVRRTCE